MIAEINSTAGFLVPDSSAIKIVIIYEDFASGPRAKGFAERLAERLGCACLLSESLWRSELLDCPPVADDAARAAAECDFLIVSLRGDRVLSFSTREWIETQLEGAAVRGTCMVALLGADNGRPRVVNGNRQYFRSACVAKGVTFFSLAAPQGERSPTGFRLEEEATAERQLSGSRQVLLHG